MLGAKVHGLSSGRGRERPAGVLLDADRLCALLCKDSDSNSVVRARLVEGKKDNKASSA